jgi:hypothetical protein
MENIRLEDISKGGKNVELEEIFPRMSMHKGC